MWCARVVGPFSTCVRSIWSKVYGATKFAKMPAPNTMISTTRPVIASRWRRNLERAYDHCDRVLSSRPAAMVVSTTPGACMAMSLTWCTIVGSKPTSCFGSISVITDARVEVPVQDVGDQVERDDDRRRHEQVRHHGVHVELSELLDEVVTDPVEREHRLRDDRAAEQSAEVERRDGDDRDQRVAENVAHDHAPLGQSLRSRRSHVVRVDHVEHRRAHVPR